VSQPRKKRRRKHRGTQAGTIDRAGRTTRQKPRTKEDARAESRRRRQERLDRPPTLKGSVQRAAIAAAFFGVLIAVVPGFGRTPLQGALLALFMFVIYIPLGYFTDKLIYNVRRKRKAAGKK
jgi:Flp pilus assembly protein TadB